MEKRNLTGRSAQEDLFRRQRKFPPKKFMSISGLFLGRLSTLSRVVDIYSISAYSAVVSGVVGGREPRLVLIPRCWKFNFGTFYGN